MNQFIFILLIRKTEQKNKTFNANQHSCGRSWVLRLRDFCFCWQTLVLLKCTSVFARLLLYEGCSFFPLRVVCSGQSTKFRTKIASTQFQLYCSFFINWMLLGHNTQDFILFLNIDQFCETVNCSLSIWNLNFQCGQDKQALVCFDRDKKLLLRTECLCVQAVLICVLTSFVCFSLDHEQHKTFWSVRVIKIALITSHGSKNLLLWLLLVPHAQNNFF